MWYYRKCRLAVLLVICFVPITVVSAAEAQCENCGIVSLFRLCELTGQELSQEQQEQITAAYPAEEASMLEMKQAAESVGITLLGVKATLEELDEVRGPKILHLQDPEHFLVIALFSPEWVQLVDRGGVAVLTREEVEKRYTGQALVLEQEESPGGPRLQLDSFHYSFGIAGVGQEVEHVFTVTNAGDEDLAITLQAKGCGAPVASIGKEALAPGESTDVTVKFTVTYSGNVMKSAKLLTNDLTQPVAFVTVHGKVPHDLRVYPDRLHVGGDKGQPLSRAVKVSGPAEMDLTEVSCDNDLFGIQVGEAEVGEDEKKTWQLELTFKPASFVGEIVDQLSIHTTHAERPLITIPITGEIRGDLDIRPATVFFGFIKPGQKAQQQVTIQSGSGAGFTVKSVQADRSEIQVEVAEQSAGQWVVSVSMNTAQAGTLDGTVTVNTDVPGEETLLIPVYAHVVTD